MTDNLFGLQSARIFAFFVLIIFFRPIDIDIAQPPIYDDLENFGPYYFPNGKRIIFSSNLHDSKGRDFDLYAITADGTDLERITHFDGFDGFPMFSPDGKHLVFASNRNQAERGDTNLFIVKWKKL